MRQPWGLPGNLLLPQWEQLRQPGAPQGVPNSRAAWKASRSQWRQCWGGWELEKRRKNGTRQLRKTPALQDCCYVVVKCWEMLSKLRLWIFFCCCSSNQFLRAQRQKTSQWNYKGMWCFWLVLVPRKWYLHSRMLWAHKIALRESALCISHTCKAEVFNILPLKTKKQKGGKNEPASPLTVNKWYFKC